MAAMTSRRTYQARVQAAAAPVASGGVQLFAARDRTRAKLEPSVSAPALPSPRAPGLPAARSLRRWGLALVAMLSGCTLAEPYLIPRRSLDLVTSLQPDLRTTAQLPAVREKDKTPALVRYGALNLDDQELQQTVTRMQGQARPARFVRARAAKQNPLLIAGGVILGMAAPHLALGLALALDKPTTDRGWSDQIGGGLTLGLGGAHLGVGALLMFIGEFRPQTENADAALVNQYLEGVQLRVVQPPSSADKPEKPDTPPPSEAPANPGTFELEAPAGAPAQN